MRTEMECRTLGENKSTYNTNSSVRQLKQKDTSSKGKSSGGGKIAVGLLAGAAAGAIAGVLLAPDKGKVTRKKVAESATKLGDQVSKGYSATKSKVEELTGSGKSKEVYINPNLSGNKHKSPYTDETKWSDREVKNMENDARNTPGL